MKKPLIYKKISINLKEISLYNFEIPTILKGDSLKIKFSISEILKSHSIYKIIAYNITFNVDSFEKNLKKDSSKTSSRSSFEKFEIKNIEFIKANLIVNNLDVKIEKINSNIISDGNSILIKLKTYNLSENKSIHQKLDSLFSQIKIYQDSIYTTSKLFSDSLKSNQIDIKIFPTKQLVYLNSKFIKFRTFNFYNISAEIETESLNISAIGDSLIFENNKIHNFDISLKLKNDTIFINEGKFNFLKGNILLSGFVFDTSFNINAKITNLKPDTIIQIDGNFKIYGNFNSN
ncbi:MAG: hypothetical protein ABIL76_03040 [candidate division WOR-3 bacterium]